MGMINKKNTWENMNPAQELEWLRTILHLSNNAGYEWHLSDNTIHWTENAATVLAVDSKDLIATRDGFETLIFAGDQQVVGDRIKTAIKRPGNFEMEYRLCLESDKIFRVRDSGTVIKSPSGSPEKIIGMITLEEDISGDSQQLHKALVKNPYNYPDDFIRSLEDTIISCKQKGVQGALLIVSIDNLPMIVDGYGHERAEQIVCSLLGMVEENLPVEGMVFRVHRDEFGVILPSCDSETLDNTARHLNEKIQRFGHQSSTAGPLHVVSTIGSVTFPSMAGTASEAFDRCHIALRSKIGSSYSAYKDTDDNQIESIEQMELANYLHNAILDQKLQFAYQPIIDAQSGNVSYYECLLRLRSDDGKITSAGGLIPIAEKMGLINQIDQLVLEMVVEDLLRDPDVVFSFNISNLTTTNPEWMDAITNILESTPEIASRMIVEITETAAQRDLPGAAYFVASLQALGCQVALDDFGSGYTSFRQLKGLSCDIVKIDRAFTKDLVDCSDNRFFVRTLLDFTDGYGLKAVAEGVETGDVAKMLMDMGVHQMQGYYFGRPYNHRVWLEKK